MFPLKTINIKSLSLKDIPAVINLSLAVFQPDQGPADPYHQPKEWQKILTLAEFY